MFWQQQKRDAIFSSAQAHVIIGRHYSTILIVSGILFFSVFRINKSTSVFHGHRERKHSIIRFRFYSSDRLIQFFSFVCWVLQCLFALIKYSTNKGIRRILFIISNYFCYFKRLFVRQLCVCVCVGVTKGVGALGTSSFN